MFTNVLVNEKKALAVTHSTAGIRACINMVYIQVARNVHPINNGQINSTL